MRSLKDDIRQVLSQTDYGQKILRAFPILVSEMVITDKVDTLGITGTGKLYVNGEFWEKHAKDSSIALFLIMHELFHVTLGDTIYITNKIREEPELRTAYNIAADMRINPNAIAIMPDTMRERVSRWLRNYYKKFPDSILAPEAKDIPARLPRVRRAYSSIHDSSWDIRLDLETLVKEIKFPELENRAKLLGSHNGEVQGKALQRKAASVLEEIAKETAKGAGYYSVAGQLKMKLQSIAEELKEHYFKAFAVHSAQAELRRALGIKNVRKPDVIPINPRHKDIALLASGYAPVIWHNIRPRRTMSNYTINVYLDVSGSVYNEIPRLLALFSKLHLSQYYVFSNIVAKTTLRQLKEGEIQTTGGTDFNCIAEHMIKEGIKIGVVVTDGYASITKEYLNELEEKNIKMHFILLEDTSYGKRTPNWIAKVLGTKVYLLDEITA